MDDIFVKKIEIDKNLENLTYEADLPIVKTLKKKPLNFNSKVTFLTGENGSGKSTLLEALALKCGFNAEGGSINFNFSTKDTHSKLCSCLIVEKGIKKPKDGFFLRAESFYNTASYIDELEDELTGMYDSYGGHSLHSCSHGESFLSLCANRFMPFGLYILDEPEVALSVAKQLVLMGIIDELSKAGAQFIIATHSVLLPALPKAEVFEIKNGTIGRTNFDKTENYLLMKRFMNAPDKLLSFVNE